MTTWQRRIVLATGLLLLAAWPVRWALLTGFPTDLTSVQGGGAWPMHLVAESITAALCLWAAAARAPRSARLLALGALGYGMINGLSYGLYGDTLQLVLALIKLGAFLAALPGDWEPAPGPRWAGGLVAFVGFGMIAFWTLQLLSGMLTDGLMTTDGDAYLIYHMAAELLAGLTALIGGMAAVMRRPAGPALAGAGGACYAAVNSVGWAVLHDPVLAAILLVSGLLVAVGAVGLWRPAVSNRHRAADAFGNAPNG